MNTTSTVRTSIGSRRAITATIVAMVASVAVAGTTAAHTDPPPWTVCAYRGLPVAVDLGAILPVNVVPPPETQAALRGEIAAGTDCTIYDLPV